MFASAGIHAGLMIVSNPSTTITLPGSSGSVMEVKIKEKQPTVKKENAVKKQNIAKPVQKKLAQKPLPQEISRQIKKTAPPSEISEKPEQNKQIVKTITPATNKQQVESKARVISIIYTELSQYFTYPKIAQRRNWQGKVLLSLRVSSSGNIENIQLKKSSGYNVLDQAAINSLRKVGNLPHVSSWLSNDIELKFPVIYKLIEG